MLPNLVSVFPSVKWGQWWYLPHRAIVPIKCVNYLIHAERSLNVSCHHLCVLVASPPLMPLFLRHTQGEYTHT